MYSIPLRGKCKCKFVHIQDLGSMLSQMPSPRFVTLKDRAAAQSVLGTALADRTDDEPTSSVDSLEMAALLAVCAWRRMVERGLLLWLPQQRALALGLAQVRARLSQICGLAALSLQTLEQ